MCEPFVVRFLLILLPNPWVKGLDFGVFGVLGLEVFLAGFLWFLLIQQVFVDHNLAMECPWGVPTIPKVLFGSVERIRRSGVGFEGVDLRVLFSSSCPCYTGLTGALDRSDRCEFFVRLVSGELLNPCVFWLCWCLSVLGCFGVVLLGFVKSSSSLQVVFWRCFGSRAYRSHLGSLEHLLCGCCSHRFDRLSPPVGPVSLVWPAQAIGPTGVAHAASRASFRYACWCVLARKVICWFLGSVPLKWLRGLYQHG
jgi:hypothetical protein